MPFSYMGNGTARRGHLIRNQEIRRIRISYSPPIETMTAFAQFYNCYISMAIN